MMIFAQVVEFVLQAILIILFIIFVLGVTFTVIDDFMGAKQ